MGRLDRMRPARVATRCYALLREFDTRAPMGGVLEGIGADGQTRTADRRFTKPLLYQLSYVGADFLMILACSEHERDDPQNRCSPREAAATLVGERGQQSIVAESDAEPRWPDGERS
jgi:hypothetical protein